MNPAPSATCARAVPSTCTVAAILSSPSGVTRRGAEHVALQLLRPSQSSRAGLRRADRSQRSPQLAALDRVDAVAHRHLAGHRDQRPVAERPRPDLGPTPGDGPDLPSTSRSTTADGSSDRGFPTPPAST